LTTGKEVSVTHDNYDAIFKYLTEMFEDKALTFYGIDTPSIVRAEKTDLPNIQVDERRMDFVFLLADGSYLHLEFQTTASVADLERFKIYDVSLYEKKRRPIRTAVIYGSGIESAREILDHGSVKYFTQAVYMGKYDGDEIYRDLLDKVSRFDKLDDVDQLNLIFLPLMKNSVSKSQRAIDAVEVAKEVRDERQREFLIGSLIGITDKFIDNEYVRKLMEVLRMTRVAREIYNEGVAEGKIEGKIEGIIEGIIEGKTESKREDIKDYLDAKFGFDSIELQKKVNELVGLDVLDKVLKRLFNVDSLDKAQTVIEEAIRAQAKLKHL
jgi:predicted transposase YdaD